MAFTESLFQEELPRSARCGKKAFVFLAFVVGLGFAALLSNWTVPVMSGDEPTLNLLAAPVQSMQPAKVLPFMQPPKTSPFMQPPTASGLLGPLSRSSSFAKSFRMNALPIPSGLASSLASQNHMTDIRNTLGFSPGQKCVYANKHASLCGNLVVLRPSTAVRATESSKTEKIDAEKIISDVTTQASEKWDAVEDKTSAVLYAGGALVALVLTNSILSTIDAIPLLPNLLETVGLGYSSWFAYKYLFTKESREQLSTDIDELKKRISG